MSPLAVSPPSKPLIDRVGEPRPRTSVDLTGLHAPVVTELTTTDPEQAHAIVAAAYADNHLRVSGSLDNFRLELAQQDLGEVTFSSARSTLTTEYAVNPLGRLIIGRILHGALTTASEHTERAVGTGQSLLMARPGSDYTTASRTTGPSPSRST